MTTPDESITVWDLMKFPHSPYRDPGDLGYTIRHIKDTLLTHGIYTCQVRADDAYGYVFHWLA